MRPHVPDSTEFQKDVNHNREKAVLPVAADSCTSIEVLDFKAAQSLKSNQAKGGGNADRSENS